MIYETFIRYIALKQKTYFNYNIIIFYPIIYYRIKKENKYIYIFKKCIINKIYT